MVAWDIFRAAPTNDMSQIVRVNSIANVVRVGERDYRLITVGIQGPPGVSSSGASYMHNQPSPATQWTINHNLGFYPHVSVLSSGLVEVDATVVHVSTNQAIVQFNAPFAGLARCI